MINDDDHDISRVHNFNTECVCNESHSYVTPLFTVALPVAWPDWQIPSRARHEVSIEMNSNIENGSNQIETQTAWSPNISLSLTPAGGLSTIYPDPDPNTVLFIRIWLHSPDSNGLYCSSGPS